MLQLVDVHAGYGESLVLRGVTLTVGERQAVALLGRNGAGKTTTLRAIMGLVPVRSGRIVWRGREIQRLKPYEVARLGISLIPQGRRIFPSLTVMENLTIGARRGRDGAGWTVPRLLEIFPVLGRRAHLGGARLSGGEQQMLAIARSLMTQPALLLCDEPSEGLAPLVVQRLAEVLGSLKASGLSLLLVEHDLDVALALADYVYILDDGQVAFQGRPEQLRADRATQIRLLGASS